jgi:hypothetical protein
LRFQTNSNADERVINSKNIGGREIRRMIFPLQFGGFKNTYVGEINDQAGTEIMS